MPGLQIRGKLAQRLRKQIDRCTEKTEADGQKDQEQENAEGKEFIREDDQRKGNHQDRNRKDEPPEYHGEMPCMIQKQNRDQGKQSSGKRRQKQDRRNDCRKHHCHFSSPGTNIIE